ncbi:MAG: 4-(cytidine 5'-diphospho)-2-C-methyl-D-erythritol kinase [Pseudomonadota bacterium]
MTQPLVLPAPAKLNLFLHITGRRDDGYHTLQTLFQLLDWGDTLSFTANRSGRIRLSGDGCGVADEDNLITRAARLLAQSDLGADIIVQKRIPAGGGLGGGSSNAATTLLALNHLWSLGHSTHHLALLGTQLGADVPVFVRGRSAWAEGIGELLTPVKLPPAWYLIVAPDCHVATGEIFSHPQLTRHSPPIKMATFFDGDSRNDCQPLVRKLYPEVDRVLNSLEKLGEARLTGTGACAFVSFTSEAEAQAGRQQLPRQWNCMVAQGVDASPVTTALE